MAVTFNSIKCPECGANLEVEEGRKKIFCSYCGTQVLITDENEYTYRYVDEAGITRSENDTKVRMRELDLEERRFSMGSGVNQTLMIIWLALSLVILVLCIIKWAIQDDFLNGFLMLFYLGGPVIGGGAYLIFKVIPGKEAEKTIRRSGGVRFPKNLEPFDDKNFETLRQALSNAGFYNIHCVNLHDLTIGLLQKPGKVESVTVDGERILTGGKYYMPDADVTITYHGK